MRDYGKVAATFWTGHTGRLLRGDRDAQVVALYLVTGPTSNMIGLYHLPVALIADHTGIPIKGASKALRRVCEAGFALFDDALEHVFVQEMAAYQIGEPLVVNDKRVVGIETLWQSFRKSPFYLDFHKRYAVSFHLPEPSPFDAPSKPGAGAGAGAGAGTGDIPPLPRHGFVPPTVEQVSEYCRERGNHVDPQTFVDFYASKGWLVGKVRMKDWQASVRTWEKNASSKSNGKPSIQDTVAAVKARLGGA